MFQLVFSCRREDVDAINDILETTNAVSITYQDHEDVPILEPELGTTPLWPFLNLQALYENQQEINFAIQSLKEAYPHLNISFEALVQQDWEKICVDDFKPQQFGKLWVCPSWVKPPDIDAINLILDPGLAFGTGTHPTTKLCLSWLANQDLTNKSLIDYGCGSGILALASLKLGVSIVHAIDIDPQALQATKNNALVNHIPKEQLKIHFPEEFVDTANVLVANILFNPLIELKNKFVSSLTKNGILVVSGILKDQVEALIDNYVSHFKYQQVYFDENWGLVIFKKA